MLGSFANELVPVPVVAATFVLVVLICCDAHACLATELLLVMFVFAVFIQVAHFPQRLGWFAAMLMLVIIIYCAVVVLVFLWRLFLVVLVYSCAHASCAGVLVRS